MTDHPIMFPENAYNERVMYVGDMDPETLAKERTGRYYGVFGVNPAKLPCGHNY